MVIHAFAYVRTPPACMCLVLTCVWALLFPMLPLCCLYLISVLRAAIDPPFPTLCPNTTANTNQQSGTEKEFNFWIPKKVVPFTMGVYLYCISISGACHAHTDTQVPPGFPKVYKADDVTSDFIVIWKMGTIGAPYPDN